MKARRWLAILLAALLSFSLTACSGGEGPASDPAQPSGSESSSAESTTPLTDGTVDVDSTQGSDPSGTTTTAAGNSSGNNTTGKKPDKPVTTTTKTDKTTAPANPGTVGNAFNIKNGTKSVVDGLNFGGKKFRFAMSGGGANIKTQIRAFQQKFNCTIEYSDFGWGVYVEKLNGAMAAGEPYDIMFLHTLFYPTNLINNLAANVEGSITTADLWDAKNPNKGGISLEVGKALSWNNKMYVMYGARKPAPEFIYYNKKMFSEAGLEDPYELYKKGQWTWDKIKTMGKTVTDGQKFMFGQELVQYPYSVTLANGAEFLKINGNSVKENLTDTKLVNSLKLFQEMTYGNQKIVSDKGGFQNTDQFIAGNVYMYFADGFQWQSLEPLAKGSNAFGKNSANLGFVPIPFGSDNKDKVYPIHAFQGWCAGNGTSDVRAAIAWAIFDSTYTDPVGDSRPAEFQAMWNAIMDSGKIVAPYTGFTSPGGSSDSIALDIAKQVSEGANIAQLLTAYRDLMQEAIDYNVKK